MTTGSSATSQQSVQQAKKTLTRFLKKLDTLPSKILQEEAQTLKAEIISETPHDTGKLERSVRVSVSKSKRRPGINASASAINVKTGYNYAGIQHEHTGYRHPKGKAHFISDPFYRAVERIEERFAEEVVPE